MQARAALSFRAPRVITGTMRVRAATSVTRFPAVLFTRDQNVNDLNVSASKIYAVRLPRFRSFSLPSWRHVPSFWHDYFFKQAGISFFERARTFSSTRWMLIVALLTKTIETDSTNSSNVVPLKALWDFFFFFLNPSLQTHFSATVRILEYLLFPFKRLSVDRSVGQINWLLADRTLIILFNQFC